MGMRIKKCGIYMVRCIETNDCYVGSSVSISNRFDQHRYALRRHEQGVIWQQHWDRYGEDGFEFFVLEECARERLREREQYYIDILEPRYNSMKTAGAAPGPEHLAQRNARIGEALRASEKAKAFHASRVGVKRPDVSAKMRGRTLSVEHVAKVSAAQKGVPSPARSAGLRASEKSAAYHASQVGAKRSAETRARMSEAMQGNTSGLGAKHSEEAKARSRAAHLGAKRSDLARQRMQLAQVLRSALAAEAECAELAKVAEWPILDVTLPREQRAYEAAMREGADAMRAYCGVA